MQRNVSRFGHDDGEYEGMGLANIYSGPIAGVKMASATSASAASAASASSPSLPFSSAGPSSSGSSRMHDDYRRSGGGRAEREEGRRRSDNGYAGREREGGYSGGHGRGSRGSGEVTRHSDIAGRVEAVMRRARGEGSDEAASSGRDHHHQRGSGNRDGTSRYRDGDNENRRRADHAGRGRGNAGSHANREKGGTAHDTMASPLHRRHIAEPLTTRPVDPRTGVPIADGGRLSRHQRERLTQAADRSESDVAASAPVSPVAQLPVERWSGTVDIFDCYENPVAVSDVYAAGGAFESMSDLAARVLPSAAGDALKHLLKRQNWEEPTALQRIAIPALLQGRDACIIGPTGTGKTAAYIIPLIARVVAKLAGTEATGAALSAATKSGIESGTICKRCELDVTVNVVCPMTGKFHQRPNPAGTSGDPFGDGEKHFTKTALLHEVAGRTEPLALVLVPSALLVQQTFKVAASLAPKSVRVGFLHRAASEEEGQRMMRAFEGCNVLVTTPEQLATALVKRKVGLKRVLTVAFDEVAQLLETQNFEAVKMALASLPKGEHRPQRAFIGSSFPKQIREPLRNWLLHKNQRIIIASGASVMDTSRDAGVAAGSGRGQGRRAPRVSYQTSAMDVVADPLETAVTTASANTTHTVYMLSRLEKIDKLKALYDSLRLTAEHRTIIFCNSFAAADFVVRSLREPLMAQYNINMMMCHGRMSPNGQRTAIAALESGATTCLVCTDTVSQGLDVTNVASVVNFDMPPHFETFVNRVGRCGRMGRAGSTFTFFAPENIRSAAPLVRFLKKSGRAGEFGRHIIPSKLLEYASQEFGDLFTAKNFFDVNKSNSATREEHHTDVAGLSERFAHFGRNNDVTKFRRPET